MKLYRIIVLHGGPKDSHTSTETYLVAEDEPAVAEWISKNKRFGDWFADYGDGPEYSLGEYPNDEVVPFREWVMANKGDLSDENGWEDAYYGVTKWGWEKVDGAVSADLNRLLDLKIAVQA